MSIAPSSRCIVLGLALFALSVGVRWVAPVEWSQPWRWQPLVSLLHGERDAMLVGIHVTAMAVLTTGVLGADGGNAARVCAFWSVSGALLELLQHPTLANAVLSAFPDCGLGGRVGEALSLSLANSRFGVDELIAAVLGGRLALLLVRHIERSSTPRTEHHGFPP
jgi:hypothetical protein